jgi:catechol 2,3-dioxygenase-like lactoylglutathione lyase family enzyme
MNHLHHVHIFASDLNKSIDFYEKAFGGKIIMDLNIAKARNVFMRIGNGRLHFYDQPPKYAGRGNIHHFGIQTDNLEEGYKRLVSMGVQFNKGISDFGFWKYIMVLAPDDILIEYFEVNKSNVPKEFHNYFDFE